MDRRVDLFGCEYDLERGFVAEIDVIELEVLSGDLADAVEHDRLGVDEVVGDDDLFSGVEKLNYRVRTDESGAAGDKN